MGAATRFDWNVVWTQTIMISSAPKRPVAGVGSWPSPVHRAPRSQRLESLHCGRSRRPRSP